MTALYGNGAFLVLILSTKKPYSSYLKKVFVFQKICFKFEVLKMFKISFQKYPDLSNGGLILKSLTYALSVGFRLKPLIKGIFVRKC